MLAGSKRPGEGPTHWRVCVRWPWFALAALASQRRQSRCVQRRLLNTHAVAMLMLPASAWHFQQKLAASRGAEKPTHCPRNPPRLRELL